MHFILSLNLSVYLMMASLLLTWHVTKCQNAFTCWIIMFLVSVSLVVIAPMKSWLRVCFCSFFMPYPIRYFLRIHSDRRKVCPSMPFSVLTRKDELFLMECSTTCSNVWWIVFYLQNRGSTHTSTSKYPAGLPVLENVAYVKDTDKGTCVLKKYQTQV